MRVKYSNMYIIDYSKFVDKYINIVNFVDLICMVEYFVLLILF